MDFFRASATYLMNLQMQLVIRVYTLISPLLINEGFNATLVFVRRSVGSRFKRPRFVSPPPPPFALYLSFACGTS